MSWRTGGLFAAGLLVGVAVGGWAVIQAHDRAVWQDNGPTHAMGNSAAVPQAQAASVSAASQGQSEARATPVSAPAAAVAPAAVAAQSCDDTAIVAKGGEDGKESLHSAPSAASTSEVSSLLLTGKEAAASGRMRDAEIAFLNACRDAQAVQGKDAALSLADAMYQLGRHYANVAQAKGARKGELLARSQRLYQAALQTYQAHYGDKGEKTRFAQQGLATVQRLAGGAVVPSAPVLAQAPAPAPAPRPVAVKQAARHDEQPAKPPAPAVAVARPEKPEKPAQQENHEKRQKQESTPATAVAEPSPPPHPAPSRPEVVEARAVPAASKAQPDHAPKPVRDEKPVHADSPAASVTPERSKPAARDESSSARADSTPSARAHRAPRDTTRPDDAQDAQDAGSSGPQASAERPHSPAPRTAPAIETRPSPVIETRPAPPREEPRHVPRSDDSAADQPPPGTASGTPTAEGSPGDPP